jgi:hypothetical protein
MTRQLRNRPENGYETTNNFHLATERDHDPQGSQLLERPGAADHPRGAKNFDSEPEGSTEVAIMRRYNR